MPSFRLWPSRIWRKPGTCTPPAANLPGLNHQTEPPATRTYHDLDYAAKTWPKAFRVVLKHVPGHDRVAEVMALGDNPRFVVTSLTLPTP